MAQSPSPQAPQPSPKPDSRRDDAVEAQAAHLGEEDAEEIAADDAGATAMAEKLGRD